MAPTIASTVVNRPAAQVFAYATDPTAAAEPGLALRLRV